MCKEELICDFAEVYGIYNLFALQVEYVSILANGLGNDSRTKRKLTGQKLESGTFLLAGIFDKMNDLVYGMSDPSKRGNPPKSILRKLLEDESEDDSEVFDTPDDFRNAWHKIVGG